MSSPKEENKRSYTVMAKGGIHENTTPRIENFRKTLALENFDILPQILREAPARELDLIRIQPSI